MAPEEVEGPPSRLIETPSGSDYSLVHWAPETALGWSCVHCRRSWTRRTEMDPWEPVEGLVAQVDDQGIRAYRDGYLTVVLGGGRRVELQQSEPPRPKVPVCRACQKADIRLDRDGRVLPHRTPEGSCHGRGYLPRWT